MSTSALNLKISLLMLDSISHVIVAIPKTKVEPCWHEVFSNTAGICSVSFRVHVT